MPKRRTSISVKKNLNTNKNSVVVNINTSAKTKRRKTYPVKPAALAPYFPIAQNFPLANDVNGFINTVNRRNEVILDSIKVDKAKSDSLETIRQPPKQMIFPKSLDDSDIEIYRSNAYTAPTSGRESIKVKEEPPSVERPIYNNASRDSSIKLSSTYLNNNRAPSITVVKDEEAPQTPQNRLVKKELPFVKPISSLNGNTIATSGRNPSNQKSIPFDATTTPSGGRISSISSNDNIRSITEIIDRSKKGVSSKNPVKRISSFLPSPVRDEASMINFLSTTDLNQFTDYREGYEAFKTYFEKSREPGSRIPSSVRFKTEFNIMKKSNL